MKKLIISIASFIAAGVLGYFGTGYVSSIIQKSKEDVNETFVGGGGSANGHGRIIATADKDAGSTAETTSPGNITGVPDGEAKRYGTLILESNKITAALKVSDTEYHYVVSGPAVKPDSSGTVAVIYCLEYEDGTKLTSDKPYFKNVKADKGGCIYFAESKDKKSEPISVSVPVRSKITPLTPEKLYEAVMSKDFNRLSKLLSEYCLKRTKSEYNYSLAWVGEKPDGVDTIYDVQNKIILDVWSSLTVQSISSNYLGFATKFTLSYTKAQYE